MTQEEFIDKLGKITPWLARASFAVSFYFAYLAISPESFWGWLMIPFLGFVFFILLEKFTQYFESIF